MRGIIGYGAYVPYYRLQRQAIADALGSGGGRGTRAVASYDEDATSMSVEAARNLLKSMGDQAPNPEGVYFTSATPPYLDKTNANAVHAALNLPPKCVRGRHGRVTTVDNGSIDLGPLRPASAPCHHFGRTHRTPVKR